MAATVPTRLLLAFALSAPAAPLAAGDDPAPAAGRPASAPREQAPRRPRAISPEVAAQLSANTPKYAPPAPAPKPTPDGELPDMREIDKPRNTIIRLPSYIVREPKPPVLSERAVHTDKGLADIAVRRFISEFDRALNRLSLPLFGSSVESRAMLMYDEEERLANMRDLNESVRMISASDQAAGTYIKREVDRTYMRTGDFGWHGSEP